MVQPAKERGGHEVVTRTAVAHGDRKRAWGKEGALVRDAARALGNVCSPVPVRHGTTEVGNFWLRAVPSKQPPQHT
ncbi:hypothetical protein EON66_06275 [archaeon]|nr:MAG: hypothetical protein EON66_06275 [archaeon]